MGPSHVWARSRRLAYVSLAVFAVACEVPHTQVDVRLVAEPLDYAAGVDHFVVRVFGGDDTSHLLAVLEPTAGADFGLPLEIPIVPAANDATRPFAIEAILFEGGPTGRRLGVQRARGAFVQNQRRALTLTFSESCESVVCERTETCLSTECRPSCVDERGDARACTGHCDGVDGAACTERVTLGARHTCALSAGRLFCWGANDEGQLGVGDLVPRTVPTPVDAPAGRWEEFAAGGLSGCGISGGTLYCTGRVPIAAPGSRDGPVVSPEPARVGDLEGWSAIRLGLDLACGIHRNEVECFGDTGGGLAEGIYGAGWRGVDVAAAHACAIDGDEFPRCWGRNQEGQLGDGTIANDLTPDEPSVSLALSALRVSLTHSCALTPGGELYCWGQDDYGQLGLGDLERESCGESHLCQRSPQRLEGEGWTHVAAGPGFSCGVREGRAYCWGRNERGQLGNGTLEESHAPFLVDTSSRVRTVECGGTHACAITETDEVLCWGDNEAGQLGFPPGENAMSASPVRVQR